MRGLLYALMVLLVAACGNSKIADGSVDGARIYNDACARCHGASGVPTPGMAARTGVKPLNTARVAELGDEEIAEQIRRGSKNKMMPAFQGALSDTQIAALVEYVRTLGPTAAPKP